MDPIFSTTYWDVCLSEHQTYFGRLVIVSREKRESLPSLTDKEQKDLFSLFGKLESFYKKEYGATMFNYSCLMNHAYRDGETPRVHWHFRPRYKASQEIDGAKITDPNFGSHYIPTLFGQKDTYPAKAKDRLSERLKSAFL